MKTFGLRKSLGVMVNNVRGSAFLLSAEPFFYFVNFNNLGLTCLPSSRARRVGGKDLVCSIHVYSFTSTH